jgi:predicted nuclease of predicted toxin-antitoxin system
MMFLLDQDVYTLTERFLKALGHDVQTAAEAGLSTADDSVLLECAQKMGRILVTRDRDFVVVEPQRHRYRPFGQ